MSIFYKLKHNFAYEYEYGADTKCYAMNKAMGCKENLILIIKIYLDDFILSALTVKIKEGSISRP